MNNVIGYIVLVVYFGHAVLIVCSYIQLSETCRKSKESRYKFMQTCTPHLLTLLNVAISLMFDVLYSRYGSNSIPQGFRIFLALAFLLMPPILNPLIYGLTLTTIRKKIMNFFFCNIKRGF